MTYFIFAAYVLLIHYKYGEYDHFPAVAAIPFFASVLFRNTDMWVFGQVMTYSIILCVVLGRFVCKLSLTETVSYALIGIKMVVLGVGLVLHSANVDSPKVGEIRDILQYVDLIILTVLALSLNGVKAVLYEGLSEHKRRTNSNQP